MALPGRAVAATPYPFKLGVASGEPAPDSVVLWTRLAPAPLNADGQGGMANADVAVDWQVSTTDRFTSLVASGTVTARYADAHSVHVVAGGLAPDADYYYRFRAQGHISPVGRTRTAPAAGTFGRDLVMAFASCAHYESGYFTAYRRMAEDRPDLILHLGDYIYEDAASAGRVRQHVGAEIVSLADYRRRYAQYKSDPDLQAAHAAAPWLVVPDDHEVENNYANMVRADSSPALTAAQWTARRTAAYRAYYENMPLRPSAAPSGNSIPLYRRVRWGTLATFHMLDTRQFRDDQACGDGWKVCADADLAARTLTGAAQEAWLLDGLGQHLRHLGRPRPAGVLRPPVRRGRRRQHGLLGRLPRLARPHPAGLARPRRAQPGRAHRRRAHGLGQRPQGRLRQPELGDDRHRAGLHVDHAPAATAAATTTIPNVATNPHLKFYSDRRGYVRTTISPRAGAGRLPRGRRGHRARRARSSTLRSFVILDGLPGLQAV